MNQLPQPTAEQRQQFLHLQQEADFALWKAREGNLAVRQAYARHLAGEGAAPTKDELEQLAGLEHDAEAKYRALRQFVRGVFGAD